MYRRAIKHRPARWRSGRGRKWLGHSVLLKVLPLVEGGRRSERRPFHSGPLVFTSKACNFAVSDGIGRIRAGVTWASQPGASGAAAGGRVAECLFAFRLHSMNWVN